MQKDASMNPLKVVFVINSMERKGDLGTPINMFMGRATCGLQENSQNKFINIWRNIELRKQKAIKEFEKKGHRYNQDSFQVGEEVLIQDPFNKTWTRSGTIQEKRVVSARQGARS